MIECSGTCARMKDNCNAVHFEASNNTCSLAQLILLEELPEEEAFPVFIETQAFNSLEQKENFLLIGQGIDKVQSYPCNFTLPIGNIDFQLGGIAVLKGKIHIYNFKTNKCYHRSMVLSGPWDETPDCVTPARNSPTMTTVGENILMTGGYVESSSSSLDTIESFDGTTWTTLSTKLSRPRIAHCSVGISYTEMIVLGGMNGPWQMRLVEKYDADGNMIETLPNLITGRGYFGCGFYQGEIYAAGGNGMSSVEVYNMQSKRWRAIANLKSNVLFPNFHVYKEKLTMFGSDNSIQIYNGETWEFASESLKNNFYRGVSVKVPCH
ncbi:kelch-like protein 20 [Eurytemora carolleeae]|uniref:kelch-like protein 20 n=1 Tax=Eurytemora carolleeae TaxID=1294199 RepID=UPI000C761234|nr:kelch-like protein 20 [Eurytemora carolleeae]|eukprot:XP_023349414.1 kelch-like protein 20 [Eurytemora affinis]